MTTTEDYIARLLQLLEAARLYQRWAADTGDYPHDEQGCIAHEALINAVKAIDGGEFPDIMP